MAHELADSDWGDWLPRAVAAADPDGLSVWYLGCNGFFLKAGDGTTVVIDPYCGIGDPPRTVRMIPVPFAPEDVRCDAVFATHEHADHVHGPTQGPILAGTSAPYYAPDDSLAVVDEEGWTDTYDVTEGQFREVTEGATVEVGGMSVHVEGANDPDATHPVSYVFEYDGVRFFHGGDARPGAAFERVGEVYDLHLGALAFGSSGYLRGKGTGEPTHTTWYSDENEVVEAAAQLGLDRLVPTHWDMWRGLTADPRGVIDHARSFAHPRTVQVVEIGDRVDLPAGP